ncbi:aryl-alcohol oxidase-like protein [Mycena olivaceomarginata]|nr:aryl-alcohol oxidase-like protein [Mycena olivaceomarginata]
MKLALFLCVLAVGGTAGSVVANRLTENPTISVLVVEDGADVRDSCLYTYGFKISSVGMKAFWNYTTTPQQGFNGRTIPYVRARILGGCSSHNGMFYTRGSRDDFDRYASITGDAGWSWDMLLPYFLKNEHWTQPADGHDTRGQFDPRVHGTHGMTSVSLNGFNYPASARVLQTTAELPSAFPFNLDMNSGNPLGVGWLQETIGGGERSSAATAYLSSRFLARPNLHIVLNTRVLRLLGNNNTAGVVFHGAEISQDSSSPSSTVTARNEIILSAGAIGTPSILQHSGIGNVTALRALGISPLVDLPSVGRNTSDHPLLTATWAVSGNETTESVRQNATRFAEAFAQWNTTRTGPLTAIGRTHLGWARLTPEQLAPFKDPSAGPVAPHIELMFYVGAQPHTRSLNADLGGELPGGHFFSTGIAAVSPASRGSVTINTTDPFAAPLIDPGLLENDLDVVALREGVKLVRQFVTAPVWADYILNSVGVLANATTDPDLDGVVRAVAGTTSHIVSTVAMSAREAPYGVVDPDLRVKGTRGLRVIDASVLPFIPGGHPQAATYIITERGADLVKAAWAMKVDD